MSQEQGLHLEILPGKMVHVIKSGSGKHRSRAVVCGNYSKGDDPDQELYAGGSDANQLRGMVRLGALHGWTCASTDIRTAFLNAPRRDRRKLVAMEIPSVFRKLNLADKDHLWLIDKALYGLTTSPRDWTIHRDEIVPTVSWERERMGRTVYGSFKKTPDDNMWRIEEEDKEQREVVWTGLMSIYVDDLFFSAEEGAIDAATKAIEKVWAISEVEKTGEGKIVKYCGFEISQAPDNNGFTLSQKDYEAEMMKRWNVTRGIEYPNFKITEEDENLTADVTPDSVKTAQSIAGALLWLATRTRPDLSVGVAAVCRLATKNPVKAIEIGRTLMEYLKGTPGSLHYTADIPTEPFGKKGQLKVARSTKTLEVFADIAYSAGSRHRSVQGLAIYFAGCPIAWQTSLQPFVTHSTAESELVSYCDGLNAGRSAEAMICSMLGVQPGTAELERVLYGDNVAAIALAHGTGNASWRTRHLRIRSSYLREALDGIAPGGTWKLQYSMSREWTLWQMALQNHSMDRHFEPSLKSWACQNNTNQLMNRNNKMMAGLLPPLSLQ